MELGEFVQKAEQIEFDLKHGGYQGNLLEHHILDALGDNIFRSIGAVDEKTLSQLKEIANNFYFYGTMAAKKSTVVNKCPVLIWFIEVTGMSIQKSKESIANIAAIMNNDKPEGWVYHFLPVRHQTTNVKFVNPEVVSEDDLEKIEEIMLNAKEIVNKFNKDE